MPDEKPTKESDLYDSAEAALSAAIDEMHEEGEVDGSAIIEIHEDHCRIGWPEADGGGVCTCRPYQVEPNDLRSTERILTDMAQARRPS